ncbi:LacI family DNA-binding transcriptional regulator [Jiangella endophytica]|uniref:LacI family DNA-binding transcriptional regulator n=1 Tax=Jiangella endophytica TaxID=1623398 RepID=UPI0018E5657E|nr:LacI family DNA-binding transcriptional regulator [Jiangella endophytica]
MADIARAAGVTKSAVSYALNGQPGVSAERRAHILELAASMGYQPNHAARALVKSRADAVGLVIPRDPRILSYDTFYADFIAGIESVLSAKGTILLFEMTDDRRAELASYKQLVGERRVDGFFLTDIRPDDERIRFLRSTSTPVVMLGPPVPGWDAPVVNDDGFGDRHPAVEHLASYGHRHIAHVSGPLSMLHNLKRIDQITSTARRLEMAPPQVIESDFSPDGGVRATTSILALSKRPTAIIYGNAVMAIAGIATAQRAGLDVPGDLSVVACDETALTTYLKPAVTAVAQDDVAVGRYAADLLLATIQQTEPPPRPAQAAARLVARDTVGPARPSTR